MCTQIFEICKAEEVEDLWKQRGIFSVTYRSLHLSAILALGFAGYRAQRLHGAKGKGSLV